MNKLKIGIEIDEILRAKWLQFDRYYVQEFGEDGIPKEQPYVFDYFNHYKWEDIKIVNKELKEPDDMPDNINPIYYKTDEEGNSLADAFLFKKTETNIMSAKEVYNQFMYNDYRFEIFANAPIMYKQLDLHVSEFLLKYKDYADFIIFSAENTICISSTLFFLSRLSSKFRNYKFINKATDIWKNVDITITTNPEILSSKIPWGKKIIKVNRPYNIDYKIGSFEILHIKDLIDNKKFEKIIKYKNK